MNVERCAVEELSYDPANARKHDDRNIEAVKSSLRRFGQQKPIVVRKDGVVIAGNGTLAAAKGLGWTHVDIVRTELEGAEATAYGIADNRTAELAEWETETLAQLIESLGEEGVDAEELGFNKHDVDKLMRALLDSGNGAEDVEPDEGAPERVQAGETWRLGRHVLTCGDSTDAEVWGRLGVPDGALCFFSPPYNLGSYLGGNKSAKKRDNAYDGVDDAKDAEGWSAMVAGMLDMAFQHCACTVMNVQPLAGNKRALLQLMHERSDRFCDVVTWFKRHGGTPARSRSVLNCSFEWLLIYGKEGQTRAVPMGNWRGTMSNVYEGPPQMQNEYASLHAATFPVHLPEFVMTELCNESKHVVDCCMGTGTTLIVAEQTGRTAYGIDITPRYCDITIERWERMTGESAERV